MESNVKSFRVRAAERTRRDNKKWPQMAKVPNEINHFRLVSETSRTLIFGLGKNNTKGEIESRKDRRPMEATPAVNPTHSLLRHNKNKTTESRIEGSLKDYKRKKNVRLHVTLNQISFLLFAPPLLYHHQPIMKTKKEKNQLNLQPWHWNKVFSLWLTLQTGYKWRHHDW